MNMLPYSGFPALPKNIEDMHNQLVTLGLNDVEALTARIKKCEDWVDNVEETELTGNPVVFQNALVVPAKSLTATLNPIQDLHGYDHPWAGGAGKNKCPYMPSKTDVGITVTTADDGTANVDGTASSYFYTESTTVLKAGSYIVSKNASGDFPYLQVRNKSTDALIVSTGAGGTETAFTLAEDTEVKCRLMVSEGATLDNVKVYPMIRLSTESSDFAPYSNICPISGRTGTTVSTRNADNTETASATISFGQTVYGGQVDFKTGRVRVTDTKEDVTLESIYVRSGNTNCDFAIVTLSSAWGSFDNLRYSYLSDKTRIYDNNETFDNITDIGVTIVYSTNTRQLAISIPKGYTLAQAQALFGTIQVFYPLATPAELTLTPAQLEMLKGYNRVSSDDASSLTITAYTGGPWEAITRAIKKVTNKTKTTKKRRK